MNKSKTALVISTTIAYIQLIIGVPLVLLFLLLIFYNNKIDPATNIICSSIFFGLPGLLLLFFSQKKRKLISNFKKYVAAISNVPNGSIQDIAATLNTSVDVVKANLELMIEKKFFANAYIDHESNCIVINKKRIQVVTTDTSQNSAQTNSNATQDAAPTNTIAAQNNTPAIKIVTVKCEGCGAINTLQTGTVGECEYCGNPIKS